MINCFSSGYKNTKIENLKLGILVGYFAENGSKIKRCHHSFSEVVDLLNSSLFPSSDILYFSEEMPILRIHEPKLRHSVKYVGSKVELCRFKEKVQKENVFCEDETLESATVDEDTTPEIATASNGNKEFDESSIAGTSAVKVTVDPFEFSEANNSGSIETEKVDDSSTSPQKYESKSLLNISSDSGLESSFNASRCLVGNSSPDMFALSQTQTN